MRCSVSPTRVLLANSHARGMTGEIGTLYGSTEVSSRGVDSVGAGFKDPATIVRELARRESESSALLPLLSASADLPSLFPQS